jgi:hypothetical protein
LGRTLNLKIMIITRKIPKAKPRTSESFNRGTEFLVIFLSIADVNEWQFAFQHGFPKNVFGENVSPGLINLAN